VILRVFPFCQFGAWLTPKSLSPCGHRGDRGCGSGAPQSSYSAERTRTDPPQAFSCAQVASGTCSTMERGDESTMTNMKQKFNIPNTRRFGGKEYHFTGDIFPDRESATRRCALYRRKGYNARTAPYSWYEFGAVEYYAGKGRTEMVFPIFTRKKRR